MHIPHGKVFIAHVVVVSHAGWLLRNARPSTAGDVRAANDGMLLHATPAGDAVRLRSTGTQHGLAMPAAVVDARVRHSARSLAGVPGLLMFF